MLENTRQIIATKNQLKQTTDHHHKLTKDFEDHKDKALKGTPSLTQLPMPNISSTSMISTKKSTNFNQSTVSCSPLRKGSRST